MSNWRSLYYLSLLYGSARMFWANYRRTYSERGITGRIVSRNAIVICLVIIFWVSLIDCRWFPSQHQIICWISHLFFICYGMNSRDEIRMQITTIHYLKYNFIIQFNVISSYFLPHFIQIMKYLHLIWRRSKFLLLIMWLCICISFLSLFLAFSLISFLNIVEQDKESVKNK